jgi:hypothetical protein
VTGRPDAEALYTGTTPGAQETLRHQQIRSATLTAHSLTLGVRIRSSDMIRSALIFAAALLVALSARAAEPPKPAAPATPPKVTTLHFGPVGGRDGPGVVGKDIRVEDWREVMKKLEVDKPDLIIVRINSCDMSDGDPAEAVKFHSVFRDLKERARVVGWIQSGCFSGSLAVLPIEEYHMFPNGSFGAISTGERDMKEPADPVVWKKHAETAAADGKHPLMVIRSMQDQLPLSVSLNPTTGAITFTQDTAGPVVLNEKKEVLTLTADQAVKYGFAKSIAETEEQLLANMGFTKLQRVGEAASAWLDEKMVKRAKAAAEKDAKRPAHDEAGMK